MGDSTTDARPYQDLISAINDLLKIRMKPGELGTAIEARSWDRLVLARDKAQDQVNQDTRYDEDNLAQRLGWIYEALNEADYRFQMFVTTKDMLNQAHHLTELSNAMGDLRSWHPSYDSDTGTMGWERDDDA